MVVARALCRERAPGIGGVLLVCLLSGCAGRYVRIDEKGMTCIEAQQHAIEAVRKLGYTVAQVSPPSPGVPGVVTAERAVGANRQRALVQVFCSVLGAEVEARAEGDSLDSLGFGNEFRDAFGRVAEQRAPVRRMAEVGVDVLVTPERARGNDIGIDFTDAALLPVRVQITNATSRSYRFRAADLLLLRADGERVRPLSSRDVLSRLPGPAGEAAIGRELRSGELAPGASASGYLYYPFSGYVRARLSLTDLESEEEEGFSVEF